jgi:hypothetical protein
LEEVTFGPKPHIVSKRLIKRKKISYFIGFIFKEEKFVFVDENALSNKCN